MALGMLFDGDLKFIIIIVPVLIIGFHLPCSPK